MVVDPTDLGAETYARAEESLAAGDLVVADDLAAQAVELFCSVDAEHPDVANALVLRARIAHAGSSFTAAHGYAERAATITEAALRAWPDESVVATIHANATAQLANALHALGRYNDAERVLVAALAAIEPRLGETATECGNLHNLLGIGHKYQARYQEAAERYARAIQIVRAHHGDDSVEMASLEHNLGGLAQARGEPAIAEPHARRAIELRQAALGPDHPEVAADLAAWATILDELGRLAEAEQALKRALSIFTETYGEQHFEVGFTLGSLGALYAGAERWDDAAPVLSRAHHILVSLLGGEHVEVARVDQYLAVVAHGRGDRVAALAHAERAFAICARAFPAEHPRTCDARETLDAIRGASKP